MAQDFHYYGSTGFGWIAADTRDKVAKGLANDCGSSILKRCKANGRPGIGATICRVPLPQAAHYTIEGYMPHTITKEDGVNDKRKGERIELSEVENVYITTMQGKTVARSVDD